MFKTQPWELTVRNSEARFTFFRFGDGRVFMNLSNIKFVIQRLFKIKERAKNYLISRIVMNILNRI